MVNIELKYYSTERPVNSLELDLIRYNLPSDFLVKCKEVKHRLEKKVYLVKVDYDNHNIILEYKE